MSLLSQKLTATCAAFVLLVFGGLAASAQDQVLNYRDADMTAFIDDVSMMTGKTFIVDPRVTGKVTVFARAPLSSDEVFAVFLSTLRVHGATALSTANGAYKVVPDEVASMDANLPNGGGADQIVTEVFTLAHADPQNVETAIKPLAHREGRVINLRGSNNLIVVDFAANVERMRSVIRRLDQDTAEIETVALANTSSAEMARLLAELLGQHTENERARAGLLALPVDGSNTLVLKGERVALDRWLPVVRDLDAKNAEKGDIRVIYLKYADAESLVPVLEQVSRTLARTGEGAGGSRASIALNKGTNALVISAEPEMQVALERVISQLDVPRAQVLVEAIIVEVSDQAARELGVQYILSGGDGSDIPFTATNYSNTAPNILAAAGALLLDNEFGEDDQAVSALRAAAVDSLTGVNGFTAGIAGQSSNGTIFGVVLNALDDDLNSNILSTPSIMTLDNEAASIIVGQEIPITTGEALGSANANPFRTIERQDVGIQLEVRPQINEGKRIKLFIRQEVSSVSGPVAPTLAELVTNKREIETTVMVDDGDVLVLGGLIENEEREGEQKIPFLGDIPLLGNAFKSTARSQSRTNLMVFIRPTIVRTAEDMRAVTSRKYDYMRGEELLRDPNGESTLDGLINDVTGRTAPPEGAGGL